MDVLGWSHRTVASWVIRADQNRDLGCLSQSNWNHCCRHQVPLQWRLLSPLVRSLLSHWETLFPMQVLPCAKILPDYFFPLTKTLSWVSVWHLAPYAVACGRGGSLQAERRGFLEDKNFTAKPPTTTAACGDLPLISCLLGVISLMGTSSAYWLLSPLCLHIGTDPSLRTLNCTR